VVVLELVSLLSISLVFACACVVFFYRKERKVEIYDGGCVLVLLSTLFAFLFVWLVFHYLISHLLDFFIYLRAEKN